MSSKETEMLSALGADKRATFRRVAVIAGGLFLGLTLKSASEGIYLPSSNGEVLLIDRLRAFEMQVGADELTFEQAQAYIGLVSEMYSEAVGSTGDRGEFAKSVYLLRDATLSRDVEGVVSQLKEDYPDVRLTQKMLDDVALIAKREFTYGVTNEDEEYILLSFSGLNRIGNKNNQYRNTGGATELRRPQVPVVGFRSSLLHEFAHLDVNGRAASPELGKEIYKKRKIFERARAISTATKFAAPNDPTEEELNYWLTFAENVGLKPEQQITIEGFGIACIVDDGKKGELNSFLEEIYADYISEQIASKYGLSYTLGYPAQHTIHTMTNFNTILNAANISFEQIVEWHRNSQLEAFLVAFAKSAHGFKSEDRTEQYAFGLRTLLAIEDAHKPINWSVLKKHYPEIDDSCDDCTPRDLGPFSGEMLFE